MANEISVTASLAYANAAFSILQKSLSINGSTFTITGKNYSLGSKSFPTTAGGTAIPLGGNTTMGWSCIKNDDPTNYVQVLSAVSGTVFLKLFAAEAAVFRFDLTVSAPAILANTAAVLCEFLLLEN
jgi:hypothetical protein